MDPDANLREQEQIINRRGATRGSVYYSDVARLDELRRALGEWLARGGFDPNWTYGPTASIYFER